MLPEVRLIVTVFYYMLTFRTRKLLIVVCKPGYLYNGTSCAMCPDGRWKEPETDGMECNSEYNNK